MSDSTPETKPGPPNPQAEGVEATSPPGGPLRQDGPADESSEGHDDDASANPAANKDAEEAGGHKIPIEDEQPDPQPDSGRLGAGPGWGHPAVRERGDLPRPALGGMTMTEHPGETPETGIEESDPNADSPEGLAGEMGVSSERQGPVRGARRGGHLRRGADPSRRASPRATYPRSSRRTTASRRPTRTHPAPTQSNPDSNPGHGRLRHPSATTRRAPTSGGIRMPPSTRTVSAFM